MSYVTRDCMKTQPISRSVTMVACLSAIRCTVIAVGCCGVALAQPSGRAPRHEGEFSIELIKSLGSLFSEDNLVPFAAGSLATAVAVMPEQNLEDYFLNHAEQFDEVGAPGEVIGNAYVMAPIIGGLFVAGRVGGDQRFKSMTFALAQGFLVNGAVTAAIKYPAKRWRPNNNDQLSFPSGHTSGSFMWATVLSRTYGAKAGIPAYAVATYVGITRLEANAHHLTDIVAGATIGYLVGRTVTRRRKSDGPPPVSWMITPVRRGFVASFSFRGPG
jgi:hypothetical protein